MVTHEDDIAADVPVSPVTAAVGGSVDVPTPEGVANLKIPSGTPNGKLFRLHGKGMPSVLKWSHPMSLGDVGRSLKKVVVTSCGRQAVL